VSTPAGRRGVAAALAAGALALAGAAGCGSDAPDERSPGAGAASGPRCGALDTGRLVGRTEQEAAALAQDAGCTVRVVRRDGEGLFVTEDFRPDRINVAVRDGRVTAVESLG